MTIIFSLSGMTSNNLIKLMKFCYNTSFTLPEHSQDLDPSYKMDIDFWECFERKKTQSYNGRNTVNEAGPVVKHHLSWHG